MAVTIAKPNEPAEGDDDLEWVIEIDDTGEFDRPPRDELPVTIAQDTLLVGGATTVRVRDIHVYVEGLLLTVDIAVRDENGWNQSEEIDLLDRLTDVHPEEFSARGGPDPLPEVTGSWAQAFARSAVAWRTYWVDTRDAQGTLTVRIRNPLDIDADPWLVVLDGDHLADARSRVIDLSGDRERH